MIRALWFTLALAAAVAWAYTAANPGCITDTECAELCPINEPDCDGGPQPSRTVLIVVRG